MNLYQIDSRINAILDRDFFLDEETGEYADINDLDQLQVERNEKIENIALYIKNLEALSAGIKAEEERLKERRQAYDKKIASLEEYLTHACEGNKFTTPKCEISFRKSTVCEVDEELLPKVWWKQKITETIDKTGLKNALKQGEDIPGAKLVDKQNITIK